MIEVVGNLWDYPADIRCITTNGFVKKNGEAVMGRGCAAEAAKKNHSLPRLLGEGIKRHGNVVQWLWGSKLGEIILAFPVKHNWFEDADPNLIMDSCTQLVKWVEDLEHIKVVVLPRPGCGNGKLTWAQVKPLLISLDDRFHIIDFAKA